MEKRNIIKNQKGFTLIEIIAVLIILGILSAVAVPKYLDLKAESETKAIQGALAAGASNVTLSWSEYLLKSGGTVPTGITSGSWVPALTPALAAIETDLGDFTASYSYASATGVTITLATGPSWFDTTATYTKTFKIN